MKDLVQCRKEIDEIDRKMAALFEERMQIAADVAEYKRVSGKKVFDKQREDEKLDAVEQMASNAYFGRGLRELFSQIMSLSRKYQYTMLAEKDQNGFVQTESLDCTEQDTVAFFGEQGSYTEPALTRVLGEAYGRKSCPTFAAVVEAVETGAAKYGVVPIENAATGDISDLYDLMAEHAVYPVAEQVIKMEPCRGLNSENVNSMRFLVLSKDKMFTADADKVSVCFEIAHESGSLYRILSHLSYNNLNMTKIESRPIPGKQFEYRFFVDFDGKLSEPAVQNALTGIKEEASRLKVLGCYKTFV